MIDTILSDLKFAVRKLRSDRSFTVAAILAMALGVGASTAIFSALRPILFQPLPYPQAHELVVVSDHLDDGTASDPTFASYRELLARSHSFQSLAVMREWQPTLDTPGSNPERLEGQRVTASFFHTLGVAPVMGRNFDSTEDRPGGQKEVILSNGLWLRRFGGDLGILGQAVTLDGVAFTVVGVMPASFDNVVEPAASAWTLLQYDPRFPADGPEWYHNVSMIGRLRPGVSRGDAERDLAIIARNRVSAFARPPWATMGAGLGIQYLHDTVTLTIRPVLLALAAAVAILLLTACVNVTNLVLARGIRRRGEMALRSALGADRQRLVMQLLSEAVALAVAGGVLGALVANAALSGLLAAAPANLPRVSAIELDGVALAFALGLSVVVGITTGLVPAFAGSRATLQHELRENRRSVSAPHRRARAALVVGQLALAVILLVCAGLLMRSMSRLFSVSPGFDATNVLTMQIRVAGPRFTNDTVTRTYFNEVIAAVRNVPGVASAALTSQVPLSGDNDMYGVHFDATATAKNAPEVIRYAVTPDFFATMRIAPLRGRVLDANDRAGAPLAAVFNQSFAARMFPGRNPIGQHVHIGADDGPWYTIVGIVPDIKQIGLGAKQTDEVFMTTDQSPFADRTLSIVARTKVPPASAASGIEQAIWSVDKTQAVSRVEPMTQLLRASESQRRFALMVFEAFAFAALLLAAIGIYGMLASGVVERFREIGIRLALGASPVDVRALVIRQGLGIAVGGVAVGSVGAMAASRAVESLLFGVGPLDALTYGLVAALIAAVAVGACWLPASRAAAVDPAITLQGE